VSSPPFITIKLEIQIPTNGGTPSVVMEAPERGRIKDPFRSILRCPDTNGSIPVRPDMGSGSGSCAATGSICAWAKFVNDFPTQVRAQVVTPAGLSAVQMLPAPNLLATVGGTSHDKGALWTWDGTNPIPGVCHVPQRPGADNSFVIWTTLDGRTWHEEDYAFNGYTGTNDPCGSPSGSPCFPISGSGSRTEPVAALSGKTFPALWCVAVGGFAVAPLLLFNATWALRQVTGTPQPTWDNAADGLSAPNVRLKLCTKNGWELALRFNGTSIAYLLPYQGNAFGPLLFAERKETLPELGSVELPRILVSAI
jgi:hypothetical protein